MIIDPDSPIGKELGLTKDSYKPYMCPRCGRTSNEHIAAQSVIVYYIDL